MGVSSAAMASPPDLFAQALDTISVARGWNRLLAAGLRCHPQADSLVFQIHPSDVALTLCTQCLRAYLQVAEGVECSSARDERTCERCGDRQPSSDFISRHQFPTKFCSACRRKWGADQRGAALKAAEAEDAEARRILVESRRKLRELEQELDEE